MVGAYQALVAGMAGLRAEAFLEEACLGSQVALGIQEAGVQVASQAASPYQASEGRVGLQAYLGGGRMGEAFQAFQASGGAQA